MTLQDANGDNISKFVKSTLPFILMSDLMKIILKRDITKFKRLLKYCFLVLSLKLSIKNASNSSNSIFGLTFALEYLLKCFSWQLSLYFVIRQAMNKFNLDFLMSTYNLYCVHLVHNSLIVLYAEMIDKSYLNLWVKTLPYYTSQSKLNENELVEKDDTKRDKENDMSGYNLWLKEFGSEACQKHYYLPEQVSKTRLKELPKNVFKSAQIQFPFVVLLYSLSFAMKVRKIIADSVKSKLMPVMKMFLEVVVVKTLRTSIVLALLPYSLSSFPTIYANLLLPLYNSITGRELSENSVGLNQVKRNSVLHVGIASALSTWVFLQEPKGRLKMMVGYTLWRIFEALIRTYIVSEESRDEVKRTMLSSIFISLTAAWSLS